MPSHPQPPAASTPTVMDSSSEVNPAPWLPTGGTDLEAAMATAQAHLRPESSPVAVNPAPWLPTGGTDLEAAMATAQAHLRPESSPVAATPAPMDLNIKTFKRADGSTVMFADLETDPLALAPRALDPAAPLPSIDALRASLPSGANIGSFTGKGQGRLAAQTAGALIDDRLPSSLPRPADASPRLFKSLADLARTLDEKAETPVDPAATVARKHGL